MIWAIFTFGYVLVAGFTTVQVEAYLQEQVRREFPMLAKSGELDEPDLMTKILSAYLGIVWPVTWAFVVLNTVANLFRKGAVS